MFLKHFAQKHSSILFGHYFRFQNNKLLKVYSDHCSKKMWFWLPCLYEYLNIMQKTWGIKT